MEPNTTGRPRPRDRAFWDAHARRDEAGTCDGDVRLCATAGEGPTFVAPAVGRASRVHVILQVQDEGTPPLTGYRRAVVTVSP